MLSEYILEPVRVAVSSSDGVVHRAKRIVDDIDVAVKFNLNNSTASSARFIRENDILQALDPHIGIIKPLTTIQNDVYQGNPTDYYVMEYTESTLEQWLSSVNAASIDNQLGIFKQICEALKHAHSRGYIHRDLHWQNILMNILPEDQVKLIDFGRAYDFSALVRLSGDQPAWGELVKPPEVRFGTLDDPQLADYFKGDIFALGIIWKILFQRNTTPVYDMFAIIAEMNQYIVGRLAAGVSPNDYYTSVSIVDRRSYYADWLNSEAYKYDSYYEIQLTDVDLARQATDISRALLNFDASQRAETVDDVINMVEGLQ